jgi:hypothetical protein
LAREAYISPIVQVIVGKALQQKTFNVYKDLLTHHSNYFRAALKDCWEEGYTETILLPDEDSSVFESFIYWMFAKKLYCKSVASEDNPEIVEEIPLAWSHIFQIYYFADRRGCPELANSALDVLFANMCQRWVIPMYQLESIYMNTLEGCTLRRFLVDFTLSNYDFADFKECYEAWPKEMLVEVICTASEKEINIVGPGGKKFREQYTTETKRSFCEKYHDHSAITEKKRKGL